MFQIIDQKIHLSPKICLIINADEKKKTETILLTVIDNSRNILLHLNNFGHNKCYYVVNICHYIHAITTINTTFFISIKHNKLVHCTHFSCKVASASSEVVD